MRGYLRETVGNLMGIKEKWSGVPSENCRTLGGVQRNMAVETLGKL